MKNIFMIMIVLMMALPSVACGQIELIRPADFRYYVTVDDDTVSTRGDFHKSIQDALAFKYQFPNSVVTVLPDGIEIRGDFPMIRDTIYTTNTIYQDTLTVYDEIIYNVDWQHRQTEPEKHIVTLDIDHAADVDPVYHLDGCGFTWTQGEVITCNEILYISVEASRAGRTVTVRDSVDLKAFNDFFLTNRESEMPFTDAVFAYSAYKLPDYTGNGIRIRRSSDNTEQDIGFDSTGRLDKSSIDAFKGVSDAFLVTIYDQSGNGHHITQADNTKQALLVEADNSYHFQMDGTDDRYEQTTSPVRGDQMNYFRLSHTGGSFQYIYDSATSNRNSVRIRNDSDFEFTDTGIIVPDIIPPNEYALWSTKIVESDTANIPYEAWKNGVHQFSELGSSRGLLEGFTIGDRGSETSGLHIGMTWDTFIGYDGFHDTTKRQSVESAINSFGESGGTTVSVEFGVNAQSDVDVDLVQKIDTAFTAPAAADASFDVPLQINLLPAIGSVGDISILTGLKMPAGFSVPSTAGVQYTANLRTDMSFQADAQSDVAFTLDVAGVIDMSFAVESAADVSVQLPMQMTLDVDPIQSQSDVNPVLYLRSGIQFQAGDMQSAVEFEGALNIGVDVLIESLASSEAKMNLVLDSSFTIASEADGSVNLSITALEIELVDGRVFRVPVRDKTFMLPTDDRTFTVK